MKKTIYTSVFALFSMAAQAATVQIDFGRSDSQTQGALNLSAATTSPLDLGDEMSGALTFAWTAGGGNSGIGSGTGFAATPSTSEESGWKNPFGGTMPFAGLGDTSRDALLVQKPEGDGSFTLTFSGLDAGIYSLDVFGGFTGRDNLSSLTYTIGGADVANASWTTYSMTSEGWTTGTAMGASSGVLLPGADSSNNKGYAASVSGIVLPADGTLTLTLQGAGIQPYYDLVPLSYVSLTKTEVVPEPATAALSLLALAGLAARRRRK